nr:hypothetical protein [Bacilli bacterium]
MINEYGIIADWLLSLCLFILYIPFNPWVLWVLGLVMITVYQVSLLGIYYLNMKSNNKWLLQGLLSLCFLLILYRFYPFLPSVLETLITLLLLSRRTTLIRYREDHEFQSFRFLIDSFIIVIFVLTMMFTRYHSLYVILGFLFVMITRLMAMRIATQSHQHFSMRKGNVRFLLFFFVLIPTIIGLFIANSYLYMSTILLVLLAILFIVSIVVAILDPEMRKRIFYSAVVILLFLLVARIVKLKFHPTSLHTFGKSTAHQGTILLPSHTVSPYLFVLMIGLIIAIVLIFIYRKMTYKNSTTQTLQGDQGIRIERLKLHQRQKQVMKDQMLTPIRRVFVQVSQFYLMKKGGIAYDETAERIKMRLLATIDQADSIKHKAILELLDAYQKERYGNLDSLSNEEIARLKQNLLTKSST